MMLNDRRLRRLINACVLDPAPEDVAIGPASIDLRLGSTFLEPGRVEGEYDTVEVTDGDPYLLRPGQSVLASSLEFLRMPTNLSGKVEGRSSWARKFLIIHAAGFIDPGFEGTVTLELVNVGPWVLRLEPGTRICQLIMEELTEPAERPYSKKPGAKYQGQRGPTGAKPDA